MPRIPCSDPRNKCLCLRDHKHENVSSNCPFCHEIPPYMADCQWEIETETWERKGYWSVSTQTNLDLSQRLARCSINLFPPYLPFPLPPAFPAGTRSRSASFLLTQATWTPLPHLNYFALVAHGKHRKNQQHSHTALGKLHLSFLFCGGALLKITPTPCIPFCA